MAAEGNAAEKNLHTILKEMGAQIRVQRESLGLSIADVQERTKIRSKYLTAVEEGDDSISPGKAYFRAFLKTYATFLGLDGLALSRTYWDLVGKEDETLPKMKAAPAEAAPARERSQPVRERPQPVLEKHEAAAISDIGASTTENSEKRGWLKGSVRSTPSKTRVTRDTPSIAAREDTGPRSRHRPRRRHRSSLGTLAFYAFLILILVALGWWYFGLRAAEKEVPTKGGNAAVPGNETLAPSLEEEAKEGTKPEGEEVKVTRQDPDPSTTIFEVEKGPLTLILETGKDDDAYCWVRVTCDGKVVYENIMAPKAKEEFTAEKEIKVRSGRPWVMRMTLNGKDLGPGGPFGPVKDLIFKADKP